MSTGNVPNISARETFYVLDKCKQTIDWLHRMSILQASDPETQSQRAIRLRQAEELISLLRVRFASSEIVDRLRAKYPDLEFDQSDPDIVMVKYRPYVLVRAQAIQWRNTLQADGLVNFWVIYEANGYVAWQPEQTDYLSLIQDLYTAPDWSVWRDAGSGDVYRLRDRTGTIGQQSATAIANSIKSRWPAITVAVLYGVDQRVVR